jgi:Flp pilus assembly protein protease CpaA
MNPLELFVGDAIALGVSFAAAMVDRRGAGIPNKLTLPTLLVAVVCAATIEPFGATLASGVVAAIVLVAIYRTGVIGGGAVKLLLGLAILLNVFSLFVVLAVLVPVVSALRRRKQEGAPAGAVEWVPIAPYAAVGTALAAAAHAAVAFAVFRR